MSTRAIRGAGAAALALGMIAPGFSSAQAATTPTPGALAGSTSSRVAALRANALRAFGQSPKASTRAGRSAIAAAPAGVTPMSSVCPAGQFPKTVRHEGFESGLPYPDVSPFLPFTWASGMAAEGSHWASSPTVAEAGVPAPYPHLVDSSYGPVPQTGKVYLSFSYRGAFNAGSAAALFNAGVWEPAPSATWTTVALDITSEATTTGDGTMDVAFGHQADTATAASFDVDNVTVYTCATPPNSGIRGDWTGQGTVDLLGTALDGGLWAYEGKGSGAFGSGVKVGSGWSTFTWQGSPGDLNGDRRTDLLARRSDGTLWLYPGRGAGFFGSGKQVGSGWNTMTAIATPGDFNLDGRPDLVARRYDGTLQLYRILTTGALQYVRQIGTGWNAMTSIIGMGDLNGDKRGDLIARRSDGRMFSYLAATTGLGLTSAKQIGTGWNGMNILTSPGDLNKDGRGDLIGRNANGTLWSYLGRSGGSVFPGKQVGTGWNGMLHIL